MTDIKKIAEDRHSIHSNHPTHRPLSNDYEYVGLMGEKAFAEKYGLKMDLFLRPNGDDGYDFRTADGIKIDVKTARKAYNLIIEEGKVQKNTIYVLARFNEDESIDFLGWEWGFIMLLKPTKDFGYGVINHYKPAEKLAKMELLEKFM